MVPEHRKLVETVADDLRYLKNGWGRSPDDHTLRRTSTTLRLLVVEQLYGRAWRAAGLERQPCIESVDLTSFLSPLKPEWVLFAVAGGGGYNGMAFGNAFMWADGITPEAHAEVTRLLTNAQPMSMPLSKFRDSLCMIAWGVHITRRHIIQYVAHTQGGAHFDQKRTLPDDLIPALLDYITDTPDSAPFRGDRRLVYNELLSIGRCVAMAADTQRFLERVGLLLR